jgi:hypothetical protein
MDSDEKSASQRGKLLRTRMSIEINRPDQSKQLCKLPEGCVGTTAYQPIIGGHK